MGFVSPTGNGIIKRNPTGGTSLLALFPIARRIVAVFTRPEAGVLGHLHRVLGSFERSRIGKSVKAALVWICQDWPKDIGFISRIVRKLTGRKRVVSQDDSLRGWGWTPETASWAEPTAFALIALDQAPVDLLPDGAKKRRELAKALLYDRMCVGGGWNCGNPMVYGVAGEPLAEPTAWALIALRSECQRSENPMSLEWLRKNISNVRGPGSLALARVCFQAYGYQWLDDYPDFIQLYNNNEFLGNVLVTTLMCLALTPAQGWLGSTFGSNNHANS